MLRRAVKEFGPKHLVDDEEDTCWNSDQVMRSVENLEICCVDS